MPRAGRPAPVPRQSVEWRADAEPATAPLGLPTATGQGHGHGDAAPAGRRVRMLLAVLLAPCALAAVVGTVLLRPTAGPPATAQATTQAAVRGQVTGAQAADCSFSGSRRCSRPPSWYWAGGAG